LEAFSGVYHHCADDAYARVCARDAADALSLSRAERPNKTREKYVQGHILDLRVVALPEINHLD
jgi:hypothetical protein